MTTLYGDLLAIFLWLAFIFVAMWANSKIKDKDEL